MHIEYAREPVYTRSMSVNLIVKFREIDEELPFTAVFNDCEQHGRELYQRAIDGEFGPIAAYVPPPPPTYEEKVEVILPKIKRLLRECDWSQLPDVPKATKDVWAIYRAALRDIPNQTQYPDAITWPTQPDDTFL